MAEWIPIILSFCLGGYLPLTRKRPANVALACAAVVLIAVSAFVLSGEYKLSWTYYVLDCLQASFALLAGNAALRAIGHPQDVRNATNRR